MKREDILGTWRSQQIVRDGFSSQPQRYTRQTLIFSANGTGVMKAKTLFGRTRNFTWEYESFNPLTGDRPMFTIYD